MFAEVRADQNDRLEVFKHVFVRVKELKHVAGVVELAPGHALLQDLGRVGVGLLLPVEGLAKEQVLQQLLPQRLSLRVGAHIRRGSRPRDLAGFGGEEAQHRLAQSKLGRRSDHIY